MRVANAARARSLLSKLGYTVSERRTFEINLLFDTSSNSLRRERKLLRLRQTGSKRIITYKGPPVAGPHKSREEIESEFSDLAAMRQILEEIGFTHTFRYEKYRTEFAKPRSGAVMLDETPIGDFLELEGAPRWIDGAARALGYTPADYITASYGTLYREYCAQQGIEPSDMVFKRRAQSRR